MKQKNLARRALSSRSVREFELPIAHAEGRLVTKDAAEAAGYVKSGAAAWSTPTTVNGSFERIAGLTDESGRVFGLMPHPERFMKAGDHYDPDWEGGEGGWGSGYWLFKSLHEAIKEGEA